MRRWLFLFLRIIAPVNAAIVAAIVMASMKYAIINIRVAPLFELITTLMKTILRQKPNEFLALYKGYCLRSLIEPPTIIKPVSIMPHALGAGTGDTLLTRNEAIVGAALLSS